MKTKKRNAVHKAIPTMAAPELRPRSSFTIAKDLIDQDYLITLSAKDRAWLRKFNEEYYLNLFKDKPLHKKKQLRKEINDSSNSRRRCLLPSELVLKNKLD